MRRLFPVVAHANLANAITATGAMLGVSGIFLAARGDARAALTCVALAIPCDTLDGVVARRMGTSSAFGAQLDSLADATAFCLLPAAIAHALGMPLVVLACAAVYALTGLLRLARFGEVGTAKVGAVECFEGVPTPIAAALLPVVVLATQAAPPGLRALALGAHYILLSAAMLSSLRVPKRGLHTRALWVAVPAALLMLWLA